MEVSVKDKRRNKNREDIIKSAEIIFFKQGYDNSTMEDIANEAGYTKKTLYSYFKSKEELYGYIIKKGYEIFTNMCISELDVYEDKNELNRIKKLAYTFLKFYNQYPGYYKATFEYTGVSLISKEIEQSSLKLLQSCIKDGIRKNQIINKDVIVLSLILWSSVMGIINTFIKKKEYIEDYITKDIDSIIENSIDLILDSIKA